MNRTRLLVLVTTMLFVGFAGYRLFAMPAISPHEGDGQFEDLSRRAPLAIRGYAISMSDFDLGQPFVASYHFSRLPDIGRGCQLYFAIPNPEWDVPDPTSVTRREIGGRLTLELLNEDGSRVLFQDGTLSDFTWGEWRGAYRLYQMEGVSFQPRRAERYTLNISYVPGTGLAGHRGHCYIESGGHK